tara:strand:+ start:502 stop:1119 length:618 start_codon:yes stop_codon:yes gene_type:complete
VFNFYRTFIYFFILTFLVIFSVYGEDAKLNKIEVIVNEQAITNYDVIQRLKINAILRQIEINNANYEVFINTVVDELISEILKMEKILEYNINVAEEELKDHENRLLNNLSFNKDQFKNILSENAVNYENFISYVETDLKWQKLIYGLYFRMTSITEIEIKELRNKTPELTNEIAKEIIIQKQLDLKSDKLIQDMKNEATIEFRS